MSYSWPQNKTILAMQRAELDYLNSVFPWHNFSPADQELFKKDEITTMKCGGYKQKEDGSWIIG